MTTTLAFTAILAAAWALAFQLLPWAAGALARALGFSGRPNPLTEKRLRRFRALRRGYAAFVLLVTAFTASLFLELYVNHLPLYLRSGDTTRYPAVRQWLSRFVPGVEGPLPIREQDLGLGGEGEVDPRQLAAWIAEPGQLSQQAEEIERTIQGDQARFREVMKAEAARRGLRYDEATPLPESKIEEAAEQRARAAALRALEARLHAGEAAMLMPLWPYSPTEQLLSLPGAPPHRPFQPGLPLLGTDAGGRDVLSQLLYGFRLGLTFALAVSTAGFGLGILLGAMMGYYGGWIDIAVQRLIEVWSSMPFFFILMILAATLQPSFWVLVCLLVIMSAWVGITYQMRGEYYRERARDYVQAAQALGVRDLPIMFRHILPNAMVPVVTLLPFAIVGEMVTLVSLDYLGFGLPPGTPSWGALLRQGSENIVNHPQLVYFPVLAFAGTLLAVVLVGEAVREAFDPKRFAPLR